MRTTLGNPVFGISVLQLTYQPRFKFTLGKEDRSVGPGVWTVDYQEVASPAMIHGEAGRDLFAHGRVWIEAQTGRVVKTELNVEQPSIRAKVTTMFRMDSRFEIAVPSEMRVPPQLPKALKFAYSARVQVWPMYSLASHTSSPSMTAAP